MKEIKNVLIIGLGAIGMIFASKIQPCKEIELYALVDHERRDRYLRDGITFNGKRFDFNYVLPENERNIKADLIIFATKSYGLKLAVEMICNYVDQNTIIISQINGITSEEIVSKAYGSDKVLYSMMLGHISLRLADGFLHDGNATIFFGEKCNDKNSEKVLKVKSLFEKAGISYEIPDDIIQTMWKKLSANVGFNQVTALTRADYSILKKNGKTTEIAIRLINEVASVAKAVGINNTEEFLPACLKIIDQMPSDAKSSMLQDVEANRKLEIDLFSGTICMLGKMHGVATPYNDMVYELLTAINEKNAF